MVNRARRTPKGDVLLSIELYDPDSFKLPGQFGAFVTTHTNRVVECSFAHLWL